MHKYDVDFYDFYNVSLCCVLRHKRECVLPFFVVLGGGFLGPTHTHTCGTYRRGYIPEYEYISVRFCLNLWAFCLPLCVYCLNNSPIWSPGSAILLHSVIHSPPLAPHFTFYVRSKANFVEIWPGPKTCGPIISA